MKPWTLAAMLAAVVMSSTAARAEGVAELQDFLKAHPEITFGHREIVSVSGGCPLIVVQNFRTPHWTQTIDWTAIKNVRLVDPWSVWVEGVIMGYIDGGHPQPATVGFSFQTQEKEHANKILGLVRSIRQGCGGQPGPDE
jgi:hypothetical protein